MNKLFASALVALSVTVVSACGDKKDQAQREEAAKQAIQQGVEKEKAMMEGMAKGVEGIEKKMSDSKDETKK
jgi:hypothetical protein